ncbi:MULTISPECIES: ROK family protein [Acidobacterium]|uniref:Glucokinase n=1 Tax=Acidobacterium capsulatum (strain ATCC 51196 / DSM 11244 / BCRC 80197 / JCM 7670 / NBRC 15755 / NCIMB 13165 / 161) TaxID=240015 RepID=C1F2C5_ACIC5|nr:MULTISPECIES: ROK family protein [Acidobacterium]ACO32528.1 glucokinase [Acidobacterium capsulatum ATCC 51196]HCT60040.1 ROK family protein [Acidobacterium sp.]
MEVFSIGVDLGGSNLRVGAFTVRGERLKLIAFPTNAASGPAAVIDSMCEAIRVVHEELVATHEFAGVGVGSPGPLSLPDGVLHQPPNLPGWDGVELRREITERLPWPVWVNSDANMAALAECRLGAGAEYGVDSLCMITLGTGVGGGIVLDGHLWHGLNGAAGEVGHGPLILNGPPCACGARGCLEVYASATAVVRRARELNLVAATEAHSDEAGTQLNAAKLAQMAEAGDAVARSIYEQAGHALGLGLANLVNTLNLPLYTIGGGVSAAWNLFAPRMFATLEEFSYVYRMSQPRDPNQYEAGKTHICRARLGSDAGLLGAAMLPLVPRPLPRA